MTYRVTRQQLLGWGRRSRLRRQGPEKELIEGFLARLFRRSMSPYRLTIFEEPKIESGFPDLVLVFWDELSTLNWRSSRADLTSDDLKVLHFLRAKPKITPFELQASIGPSVDDAIRRLSAAGLIQKRNRSWTPCPLKENFAVKKIIAIEAKISDFATGLDQAALNKWFAHESMLLVPRPIRDRKLKNRASQFDIEVLTPDSCFIIRPRVRHALPVSYASWLFNEWVWRARRSNC